MKLTRQLRLDALAADGTAPVQLTISWEGNRLRLGTGVVVRPEHWDEAAKLVKVQPGTPHAAVNPRLNRASEAAGQAQERATSEGRKLPKDELRTAVEAALRLAPVPEPAPSPAPVATADAPTTSEFDQLQRRWIQEQLYKPRGHSGKPLSKTTKAGFEATRERFHQYAEARGIELRVENLNLEFYQDFRRYMLEELGQGVNTFGKHIARLKAFLGWAEAELDMPVHRHYRKFTAPKLRGRVDALSEAELRTIAALDFTDPATRERLLVLRVEMSRATGKHQDDASAEAWLAHVELARDKFLECCYTGLRISDANRAAWQHVRGNLLVLDSTAKNEATVYIPFYDDDLFQPVALANRYEHRSPFDLLVPECYRANEFLKVVQRLSGITRLNLTTKIGRKTFVTLKLYQGVPARLIMQATGHQTEEAFNHYVGVDELRLVEEFMRKSPRRRAA
ncbi:phage integrase SAM-like domain-containing protein [Hymenobacter sp. ASUV-10]|uniref:Phage integrase SAM-like domain-containing protein n=1 Tax=Hymenobacter aranciens TaxID=3063996 RepID=A0ABT9BG64_9BACT|nr:phage integrase SAM-like domain-containing protein [Hymenobacter sp. ASUV-10]MDO7875503.1 phage integrase SAM-like domain-containing protein [Hymenobacter sp. ASUV-10]